MYARGVAVVTVRFGLGFLAAFQILRNIAMRSFVHVAVDAAQSALQLRTSGPIDRIALRALSPTAHIEPITNTPPSDVPWSRSIDHSLAARGCPLLVADEVG